MWMMSSYVAGGNRRTVRRAVRRAVGAAGLTAALAAAAAMAVPTPAAATAIDDAKAAVAAAQRAADETTQRYAEAETRAGELDGQITTLRDTITADRRRREELRLVIRDRAVRTYESHGVGAALFFDEDPIDLARREKLIAVINARDHRVRQELRALNETLAAKRHTLEDRRAQEQRVLDELAQEQRTLEEQLTSAQRALDDLQKQLEAFLAQEIARQQALAAARAARQAQLAARTPTLPPASGINIICPINGPVSFVDSWLAPRSGGVLHQGVDLMSPLGTPNVAVVSGNAVMRTGGNAGNGVRLYGDDGNLYYYFHLSAFEGSARHVALGEVIGYTGNTGDAAGGPTHTHFEIHPGGGAAVNPYPYVAAVC